jgi:hypothetical protein
LELNTHRESRTRTHTHVNCQYTLTSFMVMIRVRVSATFVQNSDNCGQVASVLNHLLCRERVETCSDCDAWVAPEKLLCLCCREACLKGTVNQRPIVLNGIVDRANRPAQRRRMWAIDCVINGSAPIGWWSAAIRRTIRADGAHGGVRHTSVWSALARRSDQQHTQTCRMQQHDVQTLIKHVRL